MGWTESFYGGTLVRILVKLDDPSKCLCEDPNDIAAFFKKEITLYEGSL